MGTMRLLYECYSLVLLNVADGLTWEYVSWWVKRRRCLMGVIQSCENYFVVTYSTFASDT